MATAPPATLVLLNGMKIDCEILSADERSVRIRDGGGAVRDFPRADVARIDIK